ncbi:MAG TPA: helix-turn-helix transcriptional regulator [Solirubrobacterales bacterium]|nr:helix-turn-helix transcriptional regulator [Solirubrobacterales bacterium]
MPKSEPQLGLAWAVRKKRTEMEMTQEELAAAAGMHLTWIGRLESNGGVNPTWASTKSIARALGVPHAELAALAEEKDRELKRIRDAGS